MSQRLADRAGAAIEKRSSRRGFLQKAAVVGTAVAIDAWDFILRPQTAWALSCSFNPQCNGDHLNCTANGGCCSGSGCYNDHSRSNYVGGCGDGYTAFCCQLSGGSNSCPSNTFIGGYWVADTNSPKFCNGGARYIIDCNSDCFNDIPCNTCQGNVIGNAAGNNPWCAGGPNNVPCNTDCASSVGWTCKCPSADCRYRRSACNWFRYGQCNHDIQCSGPVVCRVTTCTPPWQNHDCNQNNLPDYATACHRAACLNDAC